MRTATWILILVLPALSGCLSDDDQKPLPPPVDDPDRTVLWREAVDLGSRARVGAFGTSCQDSLVDGDCGLGEPSVEVDRAGTIYVSGVCCLTVAPPVYVSRDGGETFQELTTPGGLRESFGIEGDFAVDAVGRIYYADIELAGTFQVTVWDKDGNFIRHTKWPAPPLVDRDWIRAEGDGAVYYIYNTGRETLVYKSTDAAATFTAIPTYMASYPLGNAAIQPDVELCIVGGNSGGYRQADCSRDGGDTWSIETTTAPAGGNFPVPAYDEAGNLYVASGADLAISVARRDPDGTWNAAVPVSPPGGHHRLPWLAAGGPGKVAVAWYGTPDNTVSATSEWFLHVATSYNANSDPANVTWDVQVAVDEPVITGDLGRSLLDFLQVDIGPDGAIHVAYSSLPSGGGNEEQLRYVRSEANPELAMTHYFWGPPVS